MLAVIMRGKLQMPPKKSPQSTSVDAVRFAVHCASLLWPSRCIHIFLLLPCILTVACRSEHSQFESALYQSHVENVAAQSLTLLALNRGKPQQAHELATFELTFQLEDLHKMAKSVDEDQRSTGIVLAHLILKNVYEHRDQMILDRYSLQLVNDCNNLVTNKTDIEHVLELQQFLAVSATNQDTWTP